MNSIGRYQLLERIALGGMAEIFLAFERGTAGFERLVVIKRLRQEFASDDTYLEMFLREARTIARLNHPNIVSFTFELTSNSAAKMSCKRLLQKWLH